MPIIEPKAYNLLSEETELYSFFFNERHFLIIALERVCHQERPRLQHVHACSRVLSSPRSGEEGADCHLSFSLPMPMLMSLPVLERMVRLLAINHWQD